MWYILDQVIISRDVLPLLDKYPPNIVIEESLKQIEEATKGYVIGHIAKYDGTITLYTKPSRLSTLISGEKFVDIQNELEEQEKEQNKFEVFLTVKGLEYYKYRMMFVEYGMISYPASIIMEEELAVEYCGIRKTSFVINSMNEFKNMIDSVINFDRMILLIQNLINESLRQENKELTRIG